MRLLNETNMRVHISRYFRNILLYILYSYYDIYWSLTKIESQLHIYDLRGYAMKLRGHNQIHHSDLDYKGRNSLQSFFYVLRFLGRFTFYKKILQWKRLQVFLRPIIPPYVFTVTLDWSTVGDARWCVAFGIADTNNILGSYPSWPFYQSFSLSVRRLLTPAADGMLHSFKQTTHILLR